MQHVLPRLGCLPSGSDGVLYEDCRDIPHNHHRPRKGAALQLHHSQRVNTERRTGLGACSRSGSCEEGTINGRTFDCRFGPIAVLQSSHTGCLTGYRYFYLCEIFVNFQDEFKDEVPAQPSSDTKPHGETSLVDLNKQSSDTTALLQPTLDLMDQMTSNVDLLGLSLDTAASSVSNNDFGDFMSAGPLPYMPSQLLLNDLVDLSTDSGSAKPLVSAEAPSTIPAEAPKSKSSIMELFNRGVGTLKSSAQPNGGDDEKGAKEKKPKKPLTAGGKANWMDLFAELDPLANPDLMEKKLSGDHSNTQAA